MVIFKYENAPAKIEARKGLASSLELGGAMRAEQGWGQCLQVSFPCLRRLIVLADVTFPPPCISINHLLVSALPSSSPPRQVSGSGAHTRKRPCTQPAC